MFIGNDNKMSATNRMATGKITKKPLLQANVITSAKSDLTRDQRRVLYLFLRQIHISNQWPENGYMRFNHRDYAAAYGVGEQEARDDLRRALSSFRGRAVRISEDWEGELSELEIDWTTTRRVAHKRGDYSVTFNAELKSYLMPLAYELPFTVLDLNHLSMLQSKWALKLYEALCQFKSTGKWIVHSMDNLRERWDIPDSYKKPALLRNRVLTPAVMEVKRLEVFKDLHLTEKTDDRGTIEGLLFQFTPWARNNNVDDFALQPTETEQ